MFHKDLESQVTYLQAVLAKSPTIQTIFTKTPTLGLSNWYLGAGVIAQTIWNELHGYPLDQSIKDCDLVYFDPDTSSEAQDIYIEKGRKLFSTLPVDVEIVNEARVHLWYEQEPGKEIKQYSSTEDAIDTWPITAICVGVSYESGKFRVYAPYGLHDLLGMVLRPNKTLATRKVYEEKVERWRKKWPRLKVIPWDL